MAANMRARATSIRSTPPTAVRLMGPLSLLDAGSPSWCRGGPGSGQRSGHTGLPRTRQVVPFRHALDARPGSLPQSSRVKGGRVGRRVGVPPESLGLPPVSMAPSIGTSPLSPLLCTFSSISSSFPPLQASPPSGSGSGIRFCLLVALSPAAGCAVTPQGTPHVGLGCGSWIPGARWDAPEPGATMGLGRDPLQIVPVPAADAGQTSTHCTIHAPPHRPP